MFMDGPFDDGHKRAGWPKGQITQPGCAKRLKFLPFISEARTYKGL
jgi:hypothetical protein